MGSPRPSVTAGEHFLLGSPVLVTADERFIVFTSGSPAAISSFLLVIVRQAKLANGVVGPSVDYKVFSHEDLPMRTVQAKILH